MPDDLHFQEDGTPKNAQKRTPEIECAIAKICRELDNTRTFLEQLSGSEESGRRYIDGVIKRLREQLLLLQRMRDEAGNH